MIRCPQLAYVTMRAALPNAKVTDCVAH